MSDEQAPSKRSKASVSAPEPAPESAPAADDLPTLDEHVIAAKCQKWQVAALLGRNVAKGLKMTSRMSKDEFEKSLAEALHGPV